VLTLIGILALIVVALAFDVDVGFVALSIAAVLSVISPQATKGAVDKVAWSTVLVVCGIVTYVGLLENIGSIDWLGEHVADIGAALIAAMLICYVGGVVSAFASTTGILGALIPLAVPFLKTGPSGRSGSSSRSRSRPRWWTRARSPRAARSPWPILRRTGASSSSAGSCAGASGWC
jgi:di/tricarboxylate transporter